MLDIKNEQDKLLNLNNLIDDIKAINDDEILPQAEAVLKETLSHLKNWVNFRVGYTEEINEILLKESIFFEYNAVKRTFNFVTKTISELSNINKEFVLVPVALEQKRSTTKKWIQIISDENNSNIAIHKIAQVILRLGKSRMKRTIAVFAKETLNDDYEHIRLTGRFIELRDLNESFVLKNNAVYFSTKFFTADELRKILVFEWKHFSHFNWDD